MAAAAPGTVDGTENACTLLPGSIMDRFGDEVGSYFAPLGTSFGERSLPDLPQYQQYTQCMVNKPFDVMAGITRPRFGQPGLGSAVPNRCRRGLHVTADLLNGDYISKVVNKRVL